MATPDRPAGSRTVDELLALVRSRIERVEPVEAWRRLAAGALLVDTRSAEQRQRDGEVPGAVVIDRNVLEWRLDPAGPDRLPVVTGYDLEVVVLAGVAVSPSLISSFTLAEVLVPRASVTEAFTWIGTALGLGVALGASVAGKVVDVAGANMSFLVATVAAAVAAVVVALFNRMLRIPAEHAAAPVLAR